MTLAVLRTKNLDLITSLSIAALNILWAQIPNRPLAPGILFALPLIFILPGYTLTQILAHKRPPDKPPDNHTCMPQPDSNKGQPLGGVDQIVLSLGLSLATDVLVGFALNIFPVGLQALSWAISLGLFTTTAAIVAMLLRRGDMTRVTQPPRLRLSIYDGVLFGLAILVAAGAIWLAIIRPLEPQPSFTQFWMLPENRANQNCAVSLGVRNFELTPITYQVVMISNGSQISSWSSITLAPEAEWVRSVPVVPGAASSVFVEALLYRENQPNIIYRNVHLTFHIAAKNNNGQVQQACAL